MNMSKLRKLRPVRAMITAIVLTVLLCTAAGAFTISGHVYNLFDKPEPVGGIMVFLTHGVKGENAKVTTTPSTGSYEFTVDEVGTYKVWMIATSRSCYQIVDDHDNKLTPYTVKIDRDTDPAVPINIDFTAAKCVAEDTTPPEPPYNVKANPLSPTGTEIELSWVQPLPSIDPEDTDEETVSGYRIYREINQVKTFLKRIKGKNNTTYLDGNLSATTEYCYTVTAVDAAGNESLQSEETPESCDTPQTDTTPPSVPAEFTATAASSSQINLSWSASTDNTGGSGVNGYNIYRGGTLIKSLTGTPTFDSGLSASTRYCYKVAAVDAAGNESAKSLASCVATLPDTPPPVKPAEFTANAVSQSQINLSWKAVSGVTYSPYRITGNLTLADTTTGSTSDSGLSPGTRYCYQVTAVAGGIKSAPSDEACATTFSSGGVCGAITNPCTITPNAGGNSFKDTLGAGQSKYYKFIIPTTMPTATVAEVSIASEDQMQLCQMFVQEGTTDNIGPGVGTNYNAALAWYEEAPEERYTTPYYIDSYPRRWARMSEIVDGEIVYIEGIPTGTTYYVLIHNEDIGKATYWIAATMW